MGGTCDFEDTNLTRIWAKIEKEREKTRHNDLNHIRKRTCCVKIGDV